MVPVASGSRQAVVGVVPTAMPNRELKPQLFCLRCGSFASCPFLRVGKWQNEVTCGGWAADECCDRVGKVAEAAQAEECIGRESCSASRDSSRTAGPARPFDSTKDDPPAKRFAATLGVPSPGLEHLPRYDGAAVELLHPASSQQLPGRGRPHHFSPPAPPRGTLCVFRSRAWEPVAAIQGRFPVLLLDSVGPRVGPPCTDLLHASRLSRPGRMNV